MQRSGGIIRGSQNRGRRLARRGKTKKPGNVASCFGMTLGNVKLVPGMPIEAFVQTTPRTVLSYLVRPLHDQIARSYTER